MSRMNKCSISDSDFLLFFDISIMRLMANGYDEVFMNIEYIAY